MPDLNTLALQYQSLLIQRCIYASDFFFRAPILIAGLQDLLG